MVDNKRLESAMTDLKNNKINSLAIVYEEMAKGIISLVYPIVNDVFVAQDVVSETLIKVYDNIEKYSLNTSARNWILTVAKNIALSKVAKSNKEVLVDFQENNEIDASYEVETVDTETPMLKLAKDILSPKEYEILILHVIYEMKHKDIATKLNMPIGSVTWSYNNAFKKLRKAMEEKLNKEIAGE